jgi:hypothetical protein
VLRSSRLLYRSAGAWLHPCTHLEKIRTRMVCCVLHWLGGALLAVGEAPQFRRFLYIAHLLLCIPPSSLDMERGFSVSGIVKTIICHQNSYPAAAFEAAGGKAGLSLQPGSDPCHCCVQCKTPSRGEPPTVLGQAFCCHDNLILRWCFV